MSFEDDLRRRLVFEPAHEDAIAIDAQMWRDHLAELQPEIAGKMREYTERFATLLDEEGIDPFSRQRGGLEEFHAESGKSQYFPVNQPFVLLKKYVETRREPSPSGHGRTKYPYE